MKIDSISIALKFAASADRTLRMLSGFMVAVCVTSSFAALRAERAYAAGDDNAPAQRASYSQAVSEHYNSRFGADQPFDDDREVQDGVERSAERAGCV